MIWPNILHYINTSRFSLDKEPIHEQVHRHDRPCSQTHYGPGSTGQWPHPPHCTAGKPVVEERRCLEVVKSSRKVTGKLIKRNPSIAVAVAAVSVGLAGYMIYRKYKMNHKKKIVINGKGEHMLNEHADHVEVRRSIHRHRSAAAPTDNNSG